MKGILFTESPDIVEAGCAYIMVGKIIGFSAVTSHGVYSVVGTYSHDKIDRGHPLSMTSENLTPVDREVKFTISS